MFQKVSLKIIVSSNVCISHTMSDNEEMQEKRFCFFKNRNFLITNEQELIKLSDSHGIPLSFSVASFFVHNKTIQNKYKTPLIDTTEKHFKK